MKIIKEKLTGKRTMQKEQEVEAKRLAGRKAVEQVYDGTVEIHGSEQEYNAIRNISSWGYHKGFKTFMQSSLENLDSLSELVVVDSGNEVVAKYAEVNLAKEQKDALEKAARKAGLDVKDFVRAVLWTNYRGQVELHKLEEEKRKEQVRVTQGIVSNLFISGELLSKIEREYGKITTSQKLNEVLPQILKEHYKISS